MSLGGFLSRLVGLGLMAGGGYLWFRGQPPLVSVIVFGAGVAFFVGARLSR